jgi:hypothetical protein
VWPDAISRWIPHRNSIKFNAELGKNATEILASFRKESMSRTRVSVQGGPKKARQVKSKVKSMLIIFFTRKGSVLKEFVLVGQTLNSAYYSDVLQRLRENLRRLRPELWHRLALHFSPGNV